MKPPPFKYLRPDDVEGILAALGENGDDCKILAGGQSLVPTMNFRLARPEVIIDINGATDLAYIRSEDGWLHVGALARHASFHRPVVDAPLGPLLAFVVRHIAHYPIRQRGTFAGSLAHADPASEWCLVARTLDARMVLASSRGERTVEAEDFFQGTFATALAEDELLGEVQLPLLEGWKAGFQEYSRRAGDYALAMALGAYRVEDGVIAQARIGIGSLGDRPFRLPALEEALVGRPPTQAVFDEIGAAARDLVDPQDDIHASSEYRLDLVAAMVSRALAHAARQDTLSGAAA